MGSHTVQPEMETIPNMRNSQALLTTEPQIYSCGINNLDCPFVAAVNGWMEDFMIKWLESQKLNAFERIIIINHSLVINASKVNKTKT